AEKELEWKAALNQQVALLEETLASRESELRDERKKAAQLTEDFKYNLRLVKERDEELATMERENIVLKQQCLALEDKLSAMSVKHDEVAQKLAEESYSKTKLVEQCKSEQDSRERELQFIRHENELEVSRLKDEHQALRRQLEMENVRCKKELELQKRELLGALDKRAEELRDDYQNRAKQLEKSLMDSEFKCDLLDKEAASLRKARVDLLNRLETCETESAGLEKRLAEAAARYESDIAVLENEKERLQELSTSLEAKHRAALARLEEKLAAAQAEATRHEQAAAGAAARLKEERQSMRNQTSDLLAKLHEAEASFQRKATEFDTNLRAKDAEIEKLNGQLEDLQSQLHSSKADVSRLFVDKDAEIDRLRRQLEVNTEELNNRRADIDRYRHELDAALARERDRESMQHQMELDYQRKASELEALQYEKSESYIERLTQAKNEALRELESMQTTLAQKQTFIQSLLKDRETALQVMKENGIVMPDRRLESASVETDQLAASERRVRELVQQNESLKDIVKQMRLEMESLISSQPQQQQQQQQQKKQQLQLGDQKSVQEISNALSKLRSEKTDLLAQCRKQQARIGHLESQLAECQTEREAADTAAEQLRYELSAQARHHSTESAGLKRRLQELEAQLDESQREADEYYKANIEAGRLAERLQQEVLVLRSAAGSAGGEQQQQQRPGEVNFGAQELYIQQLQDEIAGLRDRMRAKQLYGDDEAEAGNESEQVSRLRAKLKMAANQIKKLAQENQALVDLSNRLRAELNTGNRGQQRPSAQASRYKPSAGSATAQHQGEPIGLESHSRRAVKDAVGDMTSKLAQLERMQYYLTREELARQNSQQQSQRNQQQQQQQQQQQKQQQQDQSLSLGDSLPVKDTGASIRRAEGLTATRPAASAVDNSLNLSSVGGGDSLRDVWRLLDSSQQQQQRYGNRDSDNSDEDNLSDTARSSNSRNQALRSLQVRGRATLNRR
ncbi:hypothetical protein BOX15_Mlig003830g1, partial [Macrostomum lignano]